MPNVNHVVNQTAVHSSLSASVCRKIKEISYQMLMCVFVEQKGCEEDDDAGADGRFYSLLCLQSRRKAAGELAESESLSFVCSGWIRQISTWPFPCSPITTVYLIMGSFDKVRPQTSATKVPFTRTQPLET